MEVERWRSKTRHSLLSAYEISRAQDGADAPEPGADREQEPGLNVPYTKRKVEHGKITREYIEYCREDAHATHRLCEATLREFLRRPVPLEASKAFSPATIGGATSRRWASALPAPASDGTRGSSGGR